MAFTKYITVDGDRWDSIATKAYGDPMNYQPIISANSVEPIEDVFPGGIELLVPIIETQKASTDVNLLPPWKRNIPAESTLEAIAAAPLFMNLQTEAAGSFDGSYD